MHALIHDVGRVLSGLCFIIAGLLFLIGVLIGLMLCAIPVSMSVVFSYLAWSIAPKEKEFWESTLWTPKRS